MKFWRAYLCGGCGMLATDLGWALGTSAQRPFGVALLGGALVMLMTCDYWLED